MFRKTISKIAAVILAAITLSVPVMADITIDPEARCSLTIRYQDAVDGNDYVSGAAFTAYKVAEIAHSGKYESMIPGLSFSENYPEHTMFVDEMTDPATYAEKVIKFYGNGTGLGTSYTCTTDSKGTGVMTDMDTGLYLVYETKAAPEHIESTPFLVSLPYKNEDIDAYGWNYDLKCSPKAVPTGRLSLKKVLQGTNIEKDKWFHFVFSFDNDMKYPYFQNGTEAGYVRDGETIVLRGGDAIEVRNIPAGTAYAVKEREADEDGYKTKAENNEGHIIKFQTANAVFINERNAQATPTPTPGAAGGGAAGGGTSAGTGKVQTGDENLRMFAIGALGGIAILMAVFATKKRKQENK